MAKNRTRLRVQLISGRGGDDVAQWLARSEAARGLDDKLGAEPAPIGMGAAADVKKDQDPVRRGARRSARKRRRPARPS